ncbi:hypothetical protein GCM10010517_43800 [Streptosporangium fragile]|uniref:Thymidylate kinase n=1 Tax=Streptosporangium fragile TaxID=46186 RepID=A0ABP6IGG5_9ACTN
MPGLFVTLDGPGGAGKSTLAELVTARLTDAGVPALATREPSRSLIGRLAREHTATFSGPTLACLVAADRHHHLAAEIRPALAEGLIVVCDRYVPSSYVLQTRDGVPLDYIRQLNAPVDRPDLAVLVTAAAPILEQRLTVRGAHSRFEHEGSSAAETTLYEDLGDVLATDGFVFHQVDTGYQSPQDAATALTSHILELSSRASHSRRERPPPPMTTTQRQQVTVDVHVILERDGHILLCLRQGTGYRDGWHCLPSGHLDPGETVIDCAIREAYEEVGVVIAPGDLRPATVVHHLSPEGRPRVGFFFVTDIWGGEVVNAEPTKCAKVEWVPIGILPSNTVPYTLAGVELYRSGAWIGVHGWPEPVAPGKVRTDMGAESSPGAAPRTNVARIR